MYLGNLTFETSIRTGCLNARKGEIGSITKEYMRRVWERLDAGGAETSVIFAGEAA